VLARSPGQEEPPPKVIPKGFDELGRPLDEGKSGLLLEESSFDDVIPMMEVEPASMPAAARIIPSGFDAKGHPLDEPMATLAATEGSEETRRRLAAASSAAMGIMAPAKRSKGQFTQFLIREGIMPSRISCRLFRKVT
jgi:hypothetical protein